MIADGGRVGLVALMQRNGWLTAVGAVTASALIFLADALSPIDGAVAVLYTTVVLMVAPLGRKILAVTGAVTAVLTIVAFLVGHLHDPVTGALLRCIVSLVAIAITVLLTMRDRSARTTLAEQARILELSHDTVIIRDTSGVIRYWNEGAEELYGWTRAEAVGQPCNELLNTIFPAEIVDEALMTAGAWSGEIVRTRRDGTQLVLASRFLQRRDAEGGAIGIIETSADLTESRRALAERRNSERRYSTIFNSAGFAALECDLSRAMKLLLTSCSAQSTLARWLEENPQLVRMAVDEIQIYNANKAALIMFDASEGAKISGRNLFLGDSGSTPGSAYIFSLLADGCLMAEIETQCITLNHRTIDAVLRVTVLPDGEDWSRVLLMAMDVTERNEARTQIEQTSNELAHAGRIAILGQLAGSLVHEVNQPLAAIINYGKSGKRWLSRPAPDCAEISDCLDKVVSNGQRAAEIVGRVRALAKKAAPQTEIVDLGQLLQDAIALLAREARVAGVTVRFEEIALKGPIVCDRVQVQQVVVNLLLNALHATGNVIDRPRDVRVVLDGSPDNCVNVTVEDTGTGIDGDPSRIFEPFFTTKSDGMGLGLSICRTIIEGQGGKMTASNNEKWGATVGFTLPYEIPTEARWRAKPNIIS